MRETAAGLRLVFLGPPASGKGTQAELVCRKYSVPQISTGEMLRERKAGGTLPPEVAQIMASGGLVPDAFVIALISERTGGNDAAGGFLLDGFPRTAPQAESLNAMLARRGQSLTAALALEVPKELLVERAVLRRRDVRSGKIYHLKFNPPPPGAELEHRGDDKEDVVRHRLDTYDTMTAELLPFYEKLGMLRRIDGTGSVSEVTGRVMDALDRVAAPARGA